MQAYGYSRARGRHLHSSTALNALSFRLETVPAETPAPHGISPTSSMRRVETPAGYISMMASSTLVSRLLQRSMTAVAKRMPLSLGILSVTWPDVVVKPRS